MWVLDFRLGASVRNLECVRDRSYARTQAKKCFLRKLRAPFRFDSADKFGGG